VRHSINSGLPAALIGTAISVDRRRALVGLAMLTAGIFVNIRVEERFIGQEFDEDYARYRSQVPALLPHVFECAAYVSPEITEKIG
jgi:protein-S-isoprenylcysteine O-methyltransferase Ste14